MRQQNRPCLMKASKRLFNSGNQCTVQSCQLPGGHDGPHMDPDQKRFTWDPYNGRMDEEDSSSISSSSSSSSFSADEMVPVREMKRRKKEKAEKKAAEQDYAVYVLEIEVT